MFERVRNYAYNCVSAWDLRQGKKKYYTCTITFEQSSNTRHSC